MNKTITPGIPDDMFIRGKVPLTKEEIRIIALSKLRLNNNSKLVDIGAGTGSISIEAARLMPGGHVYAIEKNDEAVELIKSNADKFGVNNISVIHNIAPDGLKEIPSYDRVFVGGSGGNLEKILKHVDEKIEAGAKIVITAITLDTLSIARNFYHNIKYSMEIVQVGVNRVVEIGETSMLKALNPVFIITAEKK